MFQFLVEAATLTLVGVPGRHGARRAGRLGRPLVHARFPPRPARCSVVAAVIASILTGVLFGLYPASKASRLDPVEALRYE